MGSGFIDNYSLLHFSVGVIAYFLGIPLWATFILHVMFEYVENTPQGIHFIDTHLKWWPGGKLAPDTLINSVGDTFFAILGWCVAYLISR